MAGCNYVAGRERATDFSCQVPDFDRTEPPRWTSLGVPCDERRAPPLQHREAAHTCVSHARSWLQGRWSRRHEPMLAPARPVRSFANARLRRLVRRLLWRSLVPALQPLLPALLSRRQCVRSIDVYIPPHSQHHVHGEQGSRQGRREKRANAHPRPHPRPVTRSLSTTSSHRLGSSSHPITSCARHCVGGGGSPSRLCRLRWTRALLELPRVLPTLGPPMTPTLTRALSRTQVRQ